MILSDFEFFNNFYRCFPKGNIYLVGGAVRDLLLGISSTDFDFVVEGVGSEDLVDFLEKEGKVVSVEGRNFGVFKFRTRKFHEKENAKNHEDLTVDIAVARKEQYVPGARRKDAEVSIEKVTIEEDLARRDFTINAIALKCESVKGRECESNTGKSEQPTNYSLLTTNLIDPYDSQKDLKNRLIRAVGDPRERFLEDPTRILRAIRFAVRFNFTIEEKTLAAMKELRGEITKTIECESVKGRPNFAQGATLGKKCERENEQKRITDVTDNGLIGSPSEMVDSQIPNTNPQILKYRVAWEMIREEFFKSFQADPLVTMHRYDEVGLLSILFPEIEAMKGVAQPSNWHAEGDVYTHTLLALEKLPLNSPFMTKLATLLHDIGKADTFESAKVTGDRIRFNNHDVIGAEKAAAICRRLNCPTDLIDGIKWLVKNHLRILFFFKMRKDKQKEFARHPLFDQLIELAVADAKASVRPDGSVDLSFIDSVKAVLDEIRVDKAAGKPVQIINGSEILAEILKLNPKFDPRKEGKLIGAIKLEINSMYDRGKIRIKKEAFVCIREIYEKQN